jgi:hypothetical protein
VKRSSRINNALDHYWRALARETEDQASQLVVACVACAWDVTGF